MNFADRLNALVLERRSQIVLGLDPNPTSLLPQAKEAAGDGSAAERAARAVAEHCRAIVTATGPACVAIKYQLACFERLGAPGWQALSELVEFTKQQGLLVLADAKRGDVPHTAAAYGQAFLGATDTPWGEVRGLDADAVTANPLLGRDALEPLVSAARQVAGGTFVLVRTSNPGAAEVQDRVEAGEPPLHDRLASIVAEIGADGVGECGLSDVGAVTGATQPHLVERLRGLMPRTILLLPGVGAQGGKVEDLAPAFEPGPAAGLVTAARSIVKPALESGDASDAAAAAEQLREQTWSLAAP